MPSLHILIGVVYNRNGIATWCVEAARALLQYGYRVSILTTSMDWLPEDLHAVAMVAQPPAPRNLVKKVSDKLKWWGQFFVNSSFNHIPIKSAYRQLQQQGNAPGLILVAQTDFLWPEAPVPQWVVARAWPVTLKGYLDKMNELKSQPWLSRLHDLVFWYKMDHKAYRNATGVLAITQRLANTLRQKGYRAQKLYPCVAVAGQSKGISRAVPRIITAALNLGDKRKNITLMMEVLGGLHRDQKPFDLTLVGLVDAETENDYRYLVPHARFTGRLSRGELLSEMADHDIFLFASIQENWGYVLTEAMAMGLVVITPDIYPFDEINPNPQLRFKQHHRDDLKEKISKVISNPSLLNDVKRKASEKYRASFSPAEFCKELFEAVDA
jgi:glycosyltransferase involved in cell wall biosynthesis